MRGYDAGNQAAANASVTRIVMFVEMVFDSETLRLCTGDIGYTWGGFQWLAAGHVGAVESVTESANLEAHSVGFTLNGVDSANLAIALAEPIQGRRVRLYLGYPDGDHQLNTDPEEIWAGRLDTMDIELGREGIIQVTAVNKLADWERPRVRRYTDADQKLDFPADRGFEFVSTTAEKELIWGTF